MQTDARHHGTFSEIISFSEPSTPKKHHWRWLFPVLIVASALAVISFQLWSLPVESLEHIALGLVVLFCAMAGLGTFLFGVHWGVSRDENNVKTDLPPTADSDEGETTRLLEN